MIQHLEINLKDHEGNLHPILGDNAQLMVSEVEPYRSDLIRDAIRKVEAQKKIEVARVGGHGSYIWQGDYVELVALTAK